MLWRRRAHADYPYALLLDKLKHKRDASSAAAPEGTEAVGDKLFNVMFEFEYPESSHASQLSSSVLGLVASVAIGVEGPAARVGGLHMQPIDVPCGVRAVHELSVKLCEVDGQLVGKWSFDTAVLKPDTVQRMAAHFVSILESVVTDPDQNVSDLALISKAEQHMLLHTWNNTTTQYATRNALVHHIVQEQVLRCPHNIAVQQADDKLTYEQLVRPSTPRTIMRTTSY